MKKLYLQPSTELLTFAPEDHVLEKITIKGSGEGPGVGAPLRNFSGDTQGLKYLI